jgi:hypothetical protein
VSRKGQDAACGPLLWQDCACFQRLMGRGMGLRVSTIRTLKRILCLILNCSSYRNYLMVCTALMDQHIQPMYFPLLDHPLPPSVRNLQKTVQAAWRDGEWMYHQYERVVTTFPCCVGYDIDGAKDFKNKIIGTNKWIGTAGMFTYFDGR